MKGFSNGALLDDGVIEKVAGTFELIVVNDFEVVVESVLDSTISVFVIVDCEEEE